MYVIRPIYINFAYYIYLSICSIFSWLAEIQVLLNLKSALFTSHKITAITVS